MEHSKYIFTALLLSSAIASAHGGDKPGPHGGNIEMPGAFHTELILNKDQSADIYLIDISFKNPTVKDSAVSIFARDKKNQVPFTCTVAEDHFHCIPAKKYPSKGEIVIKATRDQAVGNEAIYQLPLKFK